jgi:hypothetical protein
MAVAREFGCSRTKECDLLSSDEVRGITVPSALCCYCCFVCVCVCARARQRSFPASRWRTDGLAVFECHRSWAMGWCCHSVVTILPYHWIRWLDGIFLNTVFDCFRPCFWTSFFWSLSLIGMVHAIGVSGDYVSVKCWFHTLECCLSLDMYCVVWISDVFYFHCAPSYR